MNEIFRAFGGDTILTLEGEKWKTERRLLTPLFHFGALKHYNQIFESLGEEMVQEFRRKNGEAFATSEMKKWSGKAIVRSAFGNGIDADVILSAQNDFLEVITEIFTLTTFFGEFILKVPFLPSWKKLNRVTCKISTEVRKLIAKRKEQIKEGEEPFDLVSVMLLSKEPVPEEFIVNEGLVFLGAGSDTTSTLMVWKRKKRNKIVNVIFRNGFYTIYVNIRTFKPNYIKK
jgi:cytochrome P450